jgi:hypothetical protein
MKTFFELEQWKYTCVMSSLLKVGRPREEGSTMVEPGVEDDLRGSASGGKHLRHCLYATRPLFASKAMQIS